MFDVAGPAAARVIHLWWILLFVSTFVFVAVSGFLLIASFRSRSKAKRNISKEEKQISRGIISGVVVTVFLLIGILVGNFKYAQTFSRPDKSTSVIEVIGKRWWWALRYFDEKGTLLFETANEIHIPVGQPITFRLVSDNVIHSFWVPQLGGKVDLIPGRVNYLTLQADKPGVYRGQCAEYCGIQHAKMGFLIVAEPPEAFNEWLARQGSPAARPTNGLTQRGQGIFLNAGCGECHTIKGLVSTAHIGPDLTHFASRLTLAAASLPNKKGHLAGWITDPQNIKPGNLMPPTSLMSEDLLALLNYLGTLE